MRIVGRGTAALVGLALLAGCSGSPEEEAKSPPAQTSPPPAELARFYTQQLDWKACDEEAFECTTVEVPLDYAKPDGTTIRVAVNRAKATADRKGVLLLNPGGPGQTGLDYAVVAKASEIGRPLTEHFDIVGFDPRGVGKSAPVDCLTDPQLDALNEVDGTPDNAAEEKALVAAADTLAQGCVARSGDLAAHIGTREVARDMDVIRGALGEEKLNYLGSSYGTYLGALYAESFPGRMNRFVLDGALDPSSTDEEVGRIQAGGFDVALGAFVDDCLTKTCPLTGPRDNALKQIRAVIAQADIEPYPTAGGREVPEALAMLGVVTGMYAPANGWPILRAALTEAIQENKGDTLLALSDAYTSRTEDGYSNNSMEALPAISCLDRGSDTDVAKIKAVVPEYVKEAPTFGRFLAWGGLTCARWKVPAQDAPRKIAAKGAPPILVIGTTRDPATPLVWAQALADQLESGVLLTRDGDGHLAYHQGNDCIDSAVEDFLVDGTVPPDGRQCSADGKATDR